MSVSLCKMLKGPNAFYNKEMSTADLLKPKAKADYKVKGLAPTEDKASSLFQAYIHRALSTAAALPGQVISLVTGDSLAKNYQLIKEKGFEAKRIRVDYNQLQIDTLLVGKKDTLANRRWTIYFGGLGCRNLEMPTPFLLNFCEQTQSNLVLFNYVGYGFSTQSYPSKTTYLDSCKAVMKMVQDHLKGLNAKEVCLFGYSLGGGMVGALLEENSDLLLKSRHYVIIKDRSFSSIDKAAQGTLDSIEHLLELPFKLGPTVTKYLGDLSRNSLWDFSSTQSSRNLTDIPEIILQHAKKPRKMKKSQKTFTPYPLKRVSQLARTDNVIASTASMAHAVLSDKTYPKKNKTVLGIPETHFEHHSKKTTAYLARKVNSLFAKAKK